MNIIKNYNNFNYNFLSNIDFSGQKKKIFPLQKLYNLYNFS